MKKYKLEEKLVYYTLITQTVFLVSMKRKGKENMFRKVQRDLDRPLLRIGCSARIIHNSVQIARDCLFLDMEVIKIINIFTYIQ